jgi:hypothetical protein
MVNNIALQLDPQLTLAHLNQFEAMYRIKWNWEAALKVLSNAEYLSLGLLYMGLGDKDQAMHYFEKGYAIHSDWMRFLKRGPPFDSMRGDPRFEKLILYLKFP